MRNCKIFKIKNLIKTLIIGIFIISAICIGSGCVYSEPPKKITPHGLIVAGQKGLVNFTYNQSKHEYEKYAEATIPDSTKNPSDYPRQVIALDKYIFVNLGNEIIRLDSKLKKSISKKFSSIGSIASDNKNIYVGAEGSFIALDKNLKELSRAKFDFNFDGFIPKWKNVHSIIINKNIAYLIDNVVVPLFLFQVDISNPKHIQIIKKFKHEGSNSHLHNQWLNPELNQWLVIESYERQLGAGQEVNIYSIDSARAITSKTIYMSSLREYYDVSIDDSIVKIDPNQYYVNVSLIKPEEVTLTIKIFYDFHKVVSTESITLNKSKMSYRAKGFDNPSLVITGVEVYTNDKLIHKGKFYRDRGNSILSITNFSPAWAIIKDRDGKTYLAEIESKNNEIKFLNPLEVNYVGTGPRIRQQGDLFIYLHNKEKEALEIEIFDIQQQVKVINSVNVTHLNIGYITDFSPY